MKMVKISTVKAWGFKCLRLDVDDISTGDVKSIYCSICREYYEDLRRSDAAKGAVKVVADKYINGTTTVKKNNFDEHVKKSETHRIASLRMLERERADFKCTRYFWGDSSYYWPR